MIIRTYCMLLYCVQEVLIQFSRKEKCSPFSFEIVFTTYLGFLQYGYYYFSRTVYVHIGTYVCIIKVPIYNVCKYSKFFHEIIVIVKLL